ncbi:hypothetical protein GPALN_005456 [Globodera pallida]|nr:hypothetical protein GPALN_005456 [Globodera pallida]
MFFNSFIQFWNVQIAIYFCAVFVFLNGRRLVRSIAVFYLGGLLLGICLSFLFFGYFLQRIIPLPSITRIPLFFGGWPISLYFSYLTWTNIDLILQDYKLYAIFYLCFFGVFSLAVCYRVGPPSDIRTLNLIAWLLQLCSLAAIYFLSLSRERGVAAILSLLVVDVQQIITFIYGPQQRKLLTEDEYREEARTYTQIELDKLKRHCQSKKSRDALRLISRLHTPNKTSSFIAGDAEHISPQEQSIYSELYGSFEEQNDDMGGYITDDDDN